jgi:RHS repeat-associated protein
MQSIVSVSDILERHTYHPYRLFHTYLRFAIIAGTFFCLFLTYKKPSYPVFRGLDDNSACSKLDAKLVCKTINYKKRDYYIYVYDDAWLDQLTSYDTIINGVATNHVMTYDSQGNPTQITNVVYNGINYAYAYLDWDGRQLRSIEFAPNDEATKKMEYQYNDQGYRTTKSYYDYSISSHTWVLQNQIIYELLGDKVIYETNGTYGLLFHYDYDGTLIGFTGDLNIDDGFDGADYYYIRNQQGDITMIVDDQGTVLVEYRYDAYGNRTIVLDDTSGILSTYNPYTYKGYRYDQEIGLYYLNSRYYDPVIGRVLNPDGILGQTGNILSTNMYAYCGNNPVMYLDPSGFASEETVKNIIAAVLVIVGITALVVCAGGIAAAALGATASTVAAITTAGTIGGLVAGGVNLASQTLLYGAENLDINSIAMSTFSGTIAGMLSGAFGTLTSGTGSITSLLVQRGMQAATNLTISVSVYSASTVLSGGTITIEGLMISSFSGFVSGAFFNLPAGQGLVISLGLEGASYYIDIYNAIIGNGHA